MAELAQFQNLMIIQKKAMHKVIQEFDSTSFDMVDHDIYRVSKTS